MRANILAAGTILLGCATATEVSAQYSTAAGGRVTINRNQAYNTDAFDFANAKPMLLPRPMISPPLRRSGTNVTPAAGKPVVRRGAVGNGVQTPDSVPAPKDSASPKDSNSGISPQDYGTALLPFTTAEVSPYGTAIVNRYPFRAAGKLYFSTTGGAQNAWCTASLIGPGLVVTAAHCVALFGSGQFYSNWTFIPAYSNGAAPYGKWTAATEIVMTAYINGTDSCYQSGVVCEDDVALIVLNTQNGVYPGPSTGWLGWAYGGPPGYGYANFWDTFYQVELTQLGYPANLDSGRYQERTDGQGFWDPGLSDNTILGSAQSHGSSGGPWVVNLGKPPSGLVCSSANTACGREVVVGVTSWGYDDPNVQYQGAAPFTSNNIAIEHSTICASYPSAC